MDSRAPSYRLVSQIHKQLSSLETLSFFGFNTTPRLFFPSILIVIGVGYFTVNPFKGDGWFDEAFLNAQPAVEETEYLRHVRFDAPITIKMD